MAYIDLFKEQILSRVTYFDLSFCLLHRLQMNISQSLVIHLNMRLKIVHKIAWL